MKKRPSLKGKGVEIFLGGGKPPAQKETLLQKGKGTFYFPPAVLDALDSVWLTLRKNNRKIKKSDIVKVALEESLKEFEKAGKESALFKHFTISTL